MLRVENLRKEYAAKVVVTDISFVLAHSQTLILAGSSGSGKTTTLKMLNRLIEPTAGQIFLDDKDVSHLPVTELRRQMGYVIQTIGLFPHYTILDNILIVPRLLNWPEKQSQQRAYTLLDRLGLSPDEFMHRYPHELSGGQRQRVGIARALAANPPIILMDEPFGALDPITRQALRNDFLELEELRDKTIVMVTHDIEEAFLLGDKICLLHEGQVQQMGEPQELLFSPANAYVREFIGSQFLPLARRSFCLMDFRAQLPLGKVDGPMFTAKDTLYMVQSSLSQQKISRANFHFRGQTYNFSPLELEGAFHHKIGLAS